jgi:hypothetical protein
MTMRRSAEGLEVHEALSTKWAAAALGIALSGIGAAVFFLGSGDGMRGLGAGLFIAGAALAGWMMTRPAASIMVQLPHHALWVNGDLLAGTGEVQAIHVEGLGDPKRPGPFEIAALIGSGQRRLATISTRDNAHEVGSAIAEALGVRLIEHLDKGRSATVA